MLQSRGPGGGRKKKVSSARAPERRRVPAKVKIIASAAVFAAAVLAAGVYLYVESRPFAVWYVEDDLLNAWNRVLSSNPPPPQFVAVRSWKAGDPIAEPGFIITRHRGAQAARDTSGPAAAPKVSVYPRLSFNLEESGDIVLAVDPWMIFRKHWNPGLSYRRVTESESAGGGGEGRLLIAGRDAESVEAWTARFVLDQTGSLDAPAETWKQVRDTLFLNRPFVRGVVTFSWSDVYYFLLDSDDPAWAYAPLSRIRQLPASRTSTLQASVFPQRSDTAGYAMQADILWACPAGSERQRKKLVRSAAWLKSAETQTVLADSLGWLGANPYAEPYNPVTLNARDAWLVAAVVYDIEMPR